MTTYKSVPIKKPIFALLLSAFIPGAGQFYAGFPKKGVLYFLTPLVLYGWMVFCFLSPRIGWNIFLQAIPFFLVFFQLFIAIDAYRCAADANTANGMAPSLGKNRALIVGAIILIFSLFLNLPVLITAKATIYIRQNVAMIFKVPTDSMAPTIRDGDRIVVRVFKNPVSIKRGDIIAFTMPSNLSNLHVKRIVGLPGDKLEINGGDIVLNGQKLHSKFFYENVADSEYGASGKVIVVPEGHYFVLGDNSKQSSDSRYYGFVPQENFLGQAYKIYWPYDRARAL